jgi:hypothetical protein
MLQLQGSTLIESNTQMKGASKKLKAKKQVIGLMPIDSDQTTSDSDDWRPHLRKTEAIGSAQGGDLKSF